MTPFVAERRALRFSAISASLFAFTGLALGLASGSITILFDSGYSLLSLVLASLSLFALQQARKPADDHYPFGRLTVEPLAVLLKGVVIALVCLFSLVSALWSLAQGGRLVTLDLALMFGVVNVSGCLLTWGWLNRYAKVAQSSLLAAELRQWQMDTWLSAAVMLGFALTWGLTLSPWEHLARFADPVMVLIIAGYFLPMPIRMVKGALRELMFGEPVGSVRQEVVQEVAEFDIADDDVRLAQVGSFLMVDIQLDKQQIDDAEEIVESVEQHCKLRNLRPVTSITLVT
ncbi:MULTISPECIES: cation diffusion facilitator family transporter [Halomonadaceae]|uniref:Cation diffusion facilitator family transporter n=2 Tax=Vreelandella TaxID=3137766 RepID=A0A1H8LH70_9GAMM|nr:MULTISPECIES: cation diffusion facilitator family transporter [Halomonas]MCG7578147.1 cation diffusion facilitator family transporter [Halomonas sp. MMH1-48]MCG7589963.1 cation diffusion facilitator family transporter [Halomonas sp. McD50-5]MCG7605179.1 cation diffusion facilitator family transporter [Halomonas sp. MM17-34]MCG7614395.1 cation diffusion facilitator family transporter [Halomonas sp. MM17-29]MCG7615987.1 cation diffusion facilitator family transporter [Halomonas sp. McD50-4]M